MRSRHDPDHVAGHWRAGRESGARRHRQADRRVGSDGRTMKRPTKPPPMTRESVDQSVAGEEDPGAALDTATTSASALDVPCGRCGGTGNVRHRHVPDLRRHRQDDATHRRQLSRVHAAHVGRPTGLGQARTRAMACGYAQADARHRLCRGRVEDLRVGLPGAEGRRPRRSAAARSSRCSGPNGAGKTTLISIVCGIVNAERRHASPSTATTSSRDYRAARSKIGLVPQELTTDAFETVWATVSLQPRPVRQAAEPGAHREGAAGAVAVGQEGQQDHDALGRHEAARDDRQGAVARAADPVPRRADRRRRRRAAARHVGAGARAARDAASPSS